MTDPVRIHTATKPTKCPRRAFSMVEILVVVAILALLIGIVFKGGSAMVKSSKSRDTEGLLQILDAAIEAYKSEVSYARSGFAKNVFNGAPPDNLDVFLNFGGVQGTIAGGCPVTLARSGRYVSGGAALNPDAFVDQRGAQGQLPNGFDPRNLKRGDIRAMVLAMRLRSPKAQAIVDRIDDRFWVSGAQEGLFYDPDPGSEGDEIPLDYLVDSWEMPLEYFATCKCDPDATLPPREETSADLIHRNNDGSFLVSYGPDGRDQLSKDFFDTYGDTTIVGDYWDNELDRTINHEFNNDNLYSNEFIKIRLRKDGA